MIVFIIIVHTNVVFSIITYNSEPDGFHRKFVKRNFVSYVCYIFLNCL